MSNPAEIKIRFNRNSYLKNYIEYFYASMNINYFDSL